MQLSHVNTLVEPGPEIAKISAIAFSPNSQKLAIATSDRVVYLYDDNLVRRDKFMTKSAEKVRVNC